MKLNVNCNFKTCRSWKRHQNYVVAFMNDDKREYFTHIYTIFLKQL